MTEEEKNEYFKKLAERFVKDIQENPRKLGSKISNKIEKLERRKPILLIGKDKELILNAVIWIQFTHPKVYRSATRTQSILARCSGNPYSPAISSVNKGEIILTEYSCIGKTETKIEDDLFSSNYSFIFEYRNGEMLFVRGLNSKRILERLADLDKGFNYGVLIINVPSMDIVPQGFKDQFEVIELDAEKQDKTVDIPEAKTENVFRWCGGTWEITFDGKTIRPPDSFGLKYIHYLLKHPDKEIYATELRLITGTQLRERSTKSYDEEKKDNEESSGIESGDKMNKILDSTSIEEIKRAIGYLSEQSVGAEEEEERAELLDKKTSLEQYLKKATNINADSRDFSTDFEKARKAVSKCITNSLEIIKKEHTTLEQYLSTTIKMGNVFQYKHTSKIDWQLS